MHWDLEPNAAMRWIFGAWLVRMVVASQLVPDFGVLVHFAMLDLLAMPLIPLALLAAGMFARVPFSAVAVVLVLGLPLALGGWIAEVYGGLTFTNLYAGIGCLAIGAGLTVHTGIQPRLGHALIGTLATAFAIRGTILLAPNLWVQTLLIAAPYLVLWAVSMICMAFHKPLQRRRARAPKSF